MHEQIKKEPDDRHIEHRWMRHVTHRIHVRMSHVTHIHVDGSCFACNSHVDESCHTYNIHGRVMPQRCESTRGWVTSHIQFTYK